MSLPRPILVSTHARKGAQPKLGTAHYSYGFAAENFVRMFGRNNVAITRIDAPEQHKGPRAAMLAGMAEGEHLHLMFRSTEELRPVRGAYNIACFAWEFDRLKSDGLAEEPIQRDQVRMLKACDAVWVPCRYTQAVLDGYGIPNVTVVPAPIREPAVSGRAAALEALEDLESVPLVTSSAGREAMFEKLARKHSAPLGSRPVLQRAMAAKRVFLTICNPYDKRKSLGALIEGFLMATAGVDDAVLLVKLVTSGMFETPAGYLYHQMRVLFGNPHCLHEEKIVLFSGFLDDPEMDALYDMADFYITAAIAEGQNLPLLEAMMHGCVPIAPDHTAMADYIRPDNAVVVDSRRFRGLVPNLASDVAQARVTVDFSDRYQVRDAVARALDLSAGERVALADSARRTVIDGYGDDAVFARIADHLEQVRPALNPRIDAPKRWWGA